MRRDENPGRSQAFLNACERPVPIQSVVSWNSSCRQDAMSSLFPSECTSRRDLSRQFLRIGVALPLVSVFLALFVSGGCRYQPPQVLKSPWLPRQQVWAVAPLANESGVSQVDRLAITDALILEVASIQGVDVLPLNRTLEAMLSLEIGLDGIPTRVEYEALLSVLGADGILVGTVIAFDPYRPLRLGASIQLIEPRASREMAVDSRSLTMALGNGVSRTASDLQSLPPLQASGIFDADNHGVLIALEQYAGSRSTHDLAGTDVGLYLLDMDVYAEFVFHELLLRLLRQAPGADPADSAVATAGS